MANAIGVESKFERIKKKYEHYGEAKPNTAVADIRLLLEEIDRLVKDRK